MVPSISVIYTREAKDWNTKDPQSAYLDLNVPELTNYYVKQGVVNIAISFDGEKKHTMHFLLRSMEYRITMITRRSL